MEINHLDKETFSLLLLVPAVAGTLDPSTMLKVVLCSCSSKSQKTPDLSHQQPCDPSLSHSPRVRKKPSSALLYHTNGQESKDSWKWPKLLYISESVRRAAVQENILSGEGSLRTDVTYFFFIIFYSIPSRQENGDKAPPLYRVVIPAKVHSSWKSRSTMMLYRC